VFAYRVCQHGGPEALEWTKLPVPDPGTNEVLVAIRACALNRLDLWLRNGVEGHEFPLPLIPGSEIAGDVEVVGTGVTGIRPGDPVLVAPGVSCGFCRHCTAGHDVLCRTYGILGEQRDGGYAEYVTVPGRNILPLPRGLSYVEAAATPLVFLTAWHMLSSRAQLCPLEDILIQAAGSGVSSAGIQIAKLLGARHIIVTAGDADKLRSARKLGATHAIDYRQDDFVPEVHRITGGKGVEVVFEHVGGEVFGKSLKTLARGGRLVLCGSTAQHQVPINLRVVFFKSISILGSTMGGLAELKEVLLGVESGRLRPVVDRTYPLREAPLAQRRLESRQQFGKLVLTVGDPDRAERAPDSVSS
jgi:NADPH:quinone reductase-like Zn-dependent oxidoreductase